VELIEQLKIENANQKESILKMQVLNDHLSAELGASRALNEKLLLEIKIQKDEFETQKDNNEKHVESF
jgi:hypothetical protein